MSNQQPSISRFNDYPGDRSRNQVIPKRKGPQHISSTQYVVGHDIVSTSRQHLEKFIRELHRLTTCVKIMYSSLYPSIILENNLAPNTQIGKIIIEDPNDPNKPFSLNEHPDMYSSDDETAKYSRGGEFLENMMSGNPLEFGRRWLGLGDIHQVLIDLEEFYKYNKYHGRPIRYKLNDAVYFVKDNMIDCVTFDNRYMGCSVVEFDNSLDSNVKKELVEKIKEGAIL